MICNIIIYNVTVENICSVFSLLYHSGAFGWKGDGGLWQAKGASSSGLALHTGASVGADGGVVPLHHGGPQRGGRGSAPLPPRDGGGRPRRVPFCQPVTTQTNIKSQHTREIVGVSTRNYYRGRTRRTASPLMCAVIKQLSE